MHVILLIMFIVIRANILAGATTMVLYLYFFLTAAELGWSGFFTWVGILLVAFIAIGYLFYAFDRSKFLWKNQA